MDLNWNDNQEHELLESQKIAQETSKLVLESLFKQFPITEKYHQKFIEFYSVKKENSILDFSFIYGKWMRNSLEDDSEKILNNFSDKVKRADEEKPKTILKSNAVEEIISVQVDIKQQEDAVLQHQFEKVETAEEFGGNFKDFDGDDDLDDHSNALDEINMKYDKIIMTGYHDPTKKCIDIPIDFYTVIDLDPTIRNTYFKRKSIQNDNFDLIKTSSYNFVSCVDTTLENIFENENKHL